jgi:apolipoprotein N-acyltransferase
LSDTTHGHFATPQPPPTDGQSRLPFAVRAPRLARLRRFGLRLIPAAASGGLLGAAFHPIAAGPLAWIALVPWLLALPGSGRLYPLVSAWVVCAAWFALSLRWIATLYPGAPIVPWMIFVVVLGLQLALFAYVAKPFARGARRPLASLGIVAAWVLVEQLRTRIDAPLPFPWFHLGTTQVDWPEIAQLADLSSVIGVSALVAGVNVVILRAVQAVRRLPAEPVAVADDATESAESRPQPRRRGALAPLAVGTALLLTAWGYGTIRLAELAPTRTPADPDVPSLRVAVVQPNLVFRPGQRRGEPLAIHERLTAAAALESDAELVVWAESAMGRDFWDARVERFRKPFRAMQGPAPVDAMTDEDAMAWLGRRLWLAAHLRRAARAAQAAVEPGARNGAEVAQLAAELADAISPVLDALPNRIAQRWRLLRAGLEPGYADADMLRDIAGEILRLIDIRRRSLDIVTGVIRARDYPELWAARYQMADVASVPPTASFPAVLVGASVDIDRIHAPSGETHDQSRSYLLLTPRIGDGGADASGPVRPAIGGTHAKRELVPAGEFVPFAEALPMLVEMVRSGIGAVPTNVPGSGPGIITLPRDQGAPVRLVTPICYTIAFPHTVRDLAVTPTAGDSDGGTAADLLVNMSDESWYRTDAALDQMEAMARMRAIETRRTVIRATNTGITSVIRPDGAITAGGEVWRFADDGPAPGEPMQRIALAEARLALDGKSKEVGPAMLLADAPIWAGESPYMRLGDWVSPLATAILLISVVVAIARWRRARSGV